MISTPNDSHVQIYYPGNSGYEHTPGRTPDFWTSPKDSINLMGFQLIRSIQFNSRYTLVLRDLTRNSGYLTGLEKLQHWE